MSSKSTIALAALLAAGAFSVPAPARAQQEGMVVVRDALTGQLRNATPAEVKALRAQQPARPLSAREAAESAVTVREDGTRAKHLGERAMVYSVVARTPDGQLGMQCVKGEDAAKAALEQPAPATQPEPHHEIR